MLEAKLLRERVEDVHHFAPTALLVRAQLLEELDESGMGGGRQSAAQRAIAAMTEN